MRRKKRRNKPAPTRKSRAMGWAGSERSAAIFIDPPQLSHILSCLSCLAGDNIGEPEGRSVLLNPDSNELKVLVQKITDLPTLPAMMATITRLMQDPRTSAEELGRAIASDPALVSKVLKLVNSAFYGFPGPHQHHHPGHRHPGLQHHPQRGAHHFRAQGFRQGFRTQEPSTWGNSGNIPC